MALIISTREELDKYYQDEGLPPDKIVINNSKLSLLNPKQGGSIQKLVNSDKIESKKFKGFVTGTLIHDYSRNPEEFIVSDVSKPTEMLANMIEELYKISRTSSYDFDVDDIIASNLKSDNGKSAKILQIKKAYESLGEKLDLRINEPEVFSHVVKMIRQARKNSNAYKSYNEDTLVDLVTNSGTDYLLELIRRENKIILNPQEKAILDAGISSLKNNIVCASHLGYDSIGDSQSIFHYRELPIYFEIQVGEIIIKCKALIDNLRVDILNKKIIESDLKSTSKSKYDFKSSFEEYEYDRQHAFYKRAIKSWFIATYPQYKFEDFTYESYNVVVETTGVFNSGVYKIDDSYISLGIQKAKELVEIYAWHVDKGVYNQSREEYENEGILTLKVTL